MDITSPKVEEQITHHHLHCYLSQHLETKFDTRLIVYITAHISLLQNTFLFYRMCDCMKYKRERDRDRDVTKYKRDKLSFSAKFQSHIQSHVQLQ